jgi:hypothetical protein
MPNDAWTVEQQAKIKKPGAEVRPGGILQFQFREYSDLGRSVKQRRCAASANEGPFQMRKKTADRGLHGIRNRFTSPTYDATRFRLLRSPS